MDLRRAARHRADHKVIAESKLHGDQHIHIVNVSAHGFMIDDNPGFERGERVELRLPVIGRIEALAIWTVEKRAGFQFERVLRLPDFMGLLDVITPKLR
ncbi:MAG: PilZ domain-containing protein [Sphingorhabdus sp.]